MNIGMIAMSGIRACDPVLLELGLTLPGFVERSKQIASLPSLGLLTLAGMTPREHRVTYHEAPDLSVLPTLPTDFDLVAISSLSAQVKDAYRMAEHFRALNIPVVMGGLHVTSVPDEPARHGAIAVLGEGELAWPLILEDAARGTLVAMVGTRASCQPIPVLMMVAPAASMATPSFTISSNDEPPSTRSSIDKR